MLTGLLFAPCVGMRLAAKHVAGMPFGRGRQFTLSRMRKSVDVCCVIRERAASIGDRPRLHDFTLAPPRHNEGAPDGQHCGPKKHTVANFCVLKCAFARLGSAGRDIGCSPPRLI
jgi:hypothetical protein